MLTLFADGNILFYLLRRIQTLTNFQSDLMNIIIGTGGNGDLNYTIMVNLMPIKEPIL